MICIDEFIIFNYNIIVGNNFSCVQDNFVRTIIIYILTSQGERLVFYNTIW